MDWKELEARIESRLENHLDFYPGKDGLVAGFDRRSGSPYLTLAMLAALAGVGRGHLRRWLSRRHYRSVPVHAPVSAQMTVRRKQGVVGVQAIEDALDHFRSDYRAILSEMTTEEYLCLIAGLELIDGRRAKLRRLAKVVGEVRDQLSPEELRIADSLLEVCG